MVAGERRLVVRVMLLVVRSPLVARRSKPVQKRCDDAVWSPLSALASSSLPSGKTLYRGTSLTKMHLPTTLP